MAPECTKGNKTNKQNSPDLWKVIKIRIFVFEVDFSRFWPKLHFRVRRGNYFFLLRRMRFNIFSSEKTVRARSQEKITGLLRFLDLVRLVRCVWVISRWREMMLQVISLPFSLKIQFKISLNLVLKSVYSFVEGKLIIFRAIFCTIRALDYLPYLREW